MIIEKQKETFEGVELEVVSFGGERWLRGPQIAGALGFKNPSKAVSDIYSRNRSEFDDSTTLVIEMPTNSGRQLVRLYNARGAALIAMKAQTPKGEAFRRWVLDVLEGSADTGAVAAGENMPPTVKSALIEMFLARKNNLPIVRYRGKDLSTAEIGRLIGVSANYVNKRLRVAEYLGLVEKDPRTERFVNSDTFKKMLEARRAWDAKAQAKKRLALAGPEAAAPTGETVDAQ
jgi:prophage antirepressor-like protein